MSKRLFPTDVPCIPPIPWDIPYIPFSPMVHPLYQICLWGLNQPNLYIPWDILYPHCLYHVISPASPTIPWDITRCPHFTGNNVYEDWINLTYTFHGISPDISYIPTFTICLISPTSHLSHGISHTSNVCVRIESTQPILSHGISPIPPYPMGYTFYTQLPEVGYPLYPHFYHGISPI